MSQYLHSTEVNPRQCRGERSLQVCGWTTSLSLSCPPTPSPQPLDPCFADRGMAHKFLFPALKPSSPTTTTWVVLIEVISCVAITTAAQRAENSTGTFFPFWCQHYKCFHPLEELWLCYCLKEFRLRLAEQLIGNYCSRQRAGRGGGAIHPLPLQHFPLKVQDDTTGANKRGRCAHCMQHGHKRTDTSWFCRDCNMWLCHSGMPTRDCFLLWHKNIV